ncbi:hypothetical protein [Pseudomonas costantinii]|uniref:Uncharacterized protein n=1 Tax=Pseudomonas costantinii TaxID=168469 RepID=A0A1S2UJD7_9PSED|nr:hypothetical protein [Pseudomonas costantinii]OIN45998.1 hypothetical protein BFL40_27570 [Pseudomonas costantinii]SEE53887.1 hypothetical protein SAMN04515675_6115 [Pseudomonas costantinii]
MSKFSWKKNTVNGKDIYQVYISGQPHGNPMNTEEEANSMVQWLERKEREREAERDSGPQF